MTDEKIEETIKVFDLKNPNENKPLTLSDFYGFYDMQGETKENTLIGITFMAQLNGYVPFGTKDKLRKHLSKITK